MTEPIFDHERIEVYRLAIDYVASSYRFARVPWSGSRYVRDPWLRAIQSIPNHIVEVKRAAKPQQQKSVFRDRSRFSFAMRCNS